LSTERVITIVLGAVAAIAAFWFVLLAPKLHQESDLKAQVTSLTASATSAEQTALTGVQEQRSYHSNYAKLVRLGKAVPAEADTPSFLTQVSGISNRAGVVLGGLTLSPDTSGTAAAPPAPTTTTSTTVPATETSAALLPLGASVGPAGLAVMPYDVTFSGDYFETADLLGGLDSLVHLQKGKGSSDYTEPRVSGRLVTINSFSLTTQATAGSSSSSSALDGTLSMTTYLAPPDQGLTGGATPAAPTLAGTTPPATGAAPVTAAVTP
jgi:hypothetical protein